MARFALVVPAIPWIGITILIVVQFTVKFKGEILWRLPAPVETLEIGDVGNRQFYIVYLYCGYMYTYFSTPLPYGIAVSNHQFAACWRHHRFKVHVIAALSPLVGVLKNNRNWVRLVLLI